MEGPEASWAQGGSNVHGRSCIPEDLRVNTQTYIGNVPSQGETLLVQRRVPPRYELSRDMFGYFQPSAFFSARAEAPAVVIFLDSGEESPLSKF